MAQTFSESRKEIEDNKRSGWIEKNVEQINEVVGLTIRTIVDLVNSNKETLTRKFCSCKERSRFSVYRRNNSKKPEIVEEIADGL